MDFKKEGKSFNFKRIIDEYIFISNNWYESISNLINNFIQINWGIRLNRFETIIKNYLLEWNVISPMKIKF